MGLAGDFANVTSSAALNAVRDASKGVDQGAKHLVEGELGGPTPHGDVYAPAAAREAEAPKLAALRAQLDHNQAQGFSPIDELTLFKISFKSADSPASFELLADHSTQRAEAYSSGRYAQAGFFRDLYRNWKGVGSDYVSSEYRKWTDYAYAGAGRLMTTGKTDPESFVEALKFAKRLTTKWGQDGLFMSLLANSETPESHTLVANEALRLEKFYQARNAPGDRGLAFNVRRYASFPLDLAHDPVIIDWKAQIARADAVAARGNSRP